MDRFQLNELLLFIYFSFLSFFFYKIAFSLQKEEYFWKIKRGQFGQIFGSFSTQKRQNLDRSPTLQHIYIYTYIYNPVEITFSFCLFCSIFVAPFLSSLALLYFKLVSWHPLLKSNLFSFSVVWLFYSSCLNDIVFRLVFLFLFVSSCWFLFGFLVAVVVTFFSRLVCLFFVFLSVGVCFVLVTSVVLVSNYGKRKKCFPCGSGVFQGRVGVKPILVRMFC